MEYTVTYWNFMVILTSYSVFRGLGRKEKGISLREKEYLKAEEVSIISN